MNIDLIKWSAEKLGIPTMFGLIFCFAIYQTGKWTAVHIFDPLVLKHIEFLEVEQATMRVVATDVGRQSVEMARQTKLLEDIRNDQRKFPAVAEKTP